MNYLQKKKLAFMSIVNKVKGFVRTVSGILPLTLSDCVDGNSLINYSMQGNSVQNGTPTPDVPVEVESVGEYDEETGKYKIPVVCSDGNSRSFITNIYLDEPLRKIGSYADYIDFENGKVIRSIKERILTGTEVWSTEGAVGSAKSYYCIKMGELNTIVGNEGLCTHFKRETITAGTVTIGFNVYDSSATKISRLSFRPDITIINKVTLWIEHLKQLYANNTPIKVYYALITPDDTETLILPKLPTFKGTTVYTIDTSIQPANMSATYYATSKE